MATHVGTSLAEGQSTNRPPLFNGSNYTYWKARMKIFIQALDYDMWSIIVNGPHTPTKIIDGEESTKPEKEWDEVDKKLAQLNAKAMNVLYCALDASEFNRISTCASAKEIWDRLEVTHEGTNQVKESKINMLVHKYELFKIEHDKSITAMFTRFTDIINGLKSLGKSYTNSELVRKILRSLPRTWEAKVTAIQEAKDLNTLPLEELLGSLMTHELSMKQHQEDEVKKKRTIALKSTTSPDYETDESEDEEQDEEMALITRKFKKFLRKRKQGMRKKFTKGEQSKEKEKDQPLICYECKKPGHFRSECPQLKKGPKKFKKKAMMATWSASDDSSSDEETSTEQANLCLMAHENEVTSESTSEFTFEELHEAFYDSIDELKKLGKKNKELKLENQSLVKQAENLSIEKFTLIQENQNLKDEMNKLKSIVDKFTLSSNKLNMILENQKAIYDKAGLGYKPLKKQKFLKDIYANYSSKKPTNITCFKCGRIGHKSYTCLINKYANTKKIWVPKGTILTNLKGPKKAWVPKTET